MARISAAEETQIASYSAMVAIPEDLGEKYFLPETAAEAYQFSVRRDIPPKVPLIRIYLRDTRRQIM